MGKILAFTRYNLIDVPESLRLLAHKIECGDIMAERCLVILDDSATVEYRAFGAEPFTNAHAVGLCHIAACKIMTPDEREDDE